MISGESWMARHNTAVGSRAFQYEFAVSLY